MRARLEQVQFHLKRRVAEEPRELRLCIYFCRHKIEDQNLQRSDVLSHGSGIGHDEYVLFCEGLHCRKIVWYFDWHIYSPLN